MDPRIRAMFDEARKTTTGPIALIGSVIHTVDENGKFQPKENK